MIKVKHYSTLFFRNKLGLHVSNIETLQKKTNNRRINRVTLNASWSNVSTELTIHFVPLWARINNQADTVLEEARYKRMVNKNLLGQGERAERWRSAIIQQQQIRTSGKKKQKINKAHYINTVVCCQTHYHIPEARLFSRCIADTKHFKNCSHDSK